MFHICGNKSCITSLCGRTPPCDLSLLVSVDEFWEQLEFLRCPDCVKKTRKRPRQREAILDRGDLPKPPKPKPPRIA